MARDFTSPRSPDLPANDRESPGRSPRLTTWASIPYLIAAILLPGLFATQQMSFLRNVGPDLHDAGVVIAVAGAVLGIIAFLRLIRTRRLERNGKAAAAAFIAGTIIFLIAALVMATTPRPDSVPRVGGVRGEAVQ